jgi:alpha-L-rhamnosidase
MKKQFIQSLLLLTLIVNYVNSAIMKERYDIDSKVSKTSVSVTDLRCEYLTDPLGIDVNPRLSWKITDPDRTRGQKQSAYRVLVASSRDNLGKNIGDLWDSGKVQSEQSIHVAYDGKELTSRMQCFWKVKVWPALSQVEEDKDDKASNWSENGLALRLH